MDGPRRRHPPGLEPRHRARGDASRPSTSTQGTVLTQSVVEAMRTTSAKRILYASGSGVYGDLGTREAAEDHGPLVPVSTYGASKLAGEALIACYAAMFGLSRLRLPLRQRRRPAPDPRRRLRLRARAAAARCAATAADPLRILGDGSQTKSYIHVDDIVRAVLTAHDRRDRAVRRLQRRDRRLHHGARDRRAGGRVRRARPPASVALRLHRRRPRLEGRRPDRAPRHRADPRARLALRAPVARGPAPVDRSR